MITKPFYPKPSKPVAGFDVSTIFRKAYIKGDVGIEIEVEGNKFQKEGLPSAWTYHKDNSLRGKDNAEYVLKAPISFEEVPTAVKTLWDMFDNYGTVLDVSNRTSVHVHLNVQKFYLNRLTAFMALYFSIEEILTEWCGDHRVGNLFCLRAKDAHGIVSQVKKFIQTNGHADIKDGMHYAGLNAQALAKFGSVEIRTLRGCTDPDTVMTWVSILERIYKMSADFNDPRDVMANFSSEGPMAYLQNILGDNYSVVRENVSFDTDRILESLYEGIRLAQDLCYCRDWSLYVPSDRKSDPFGRRSKTMSVMDAYLDSIAAAQPGFYTPSPSLHTAYASQSPTGMAQSSNLLNPLNSAPATWAVPMPDEEENEAEEDNEEEDDDEI